MTALRDMPRPTAAIDHALLIRDGNFFCQDCFADFDTPQDGHLCPRCGAERLSQAPEDDLTCHCSARCPRPHSCPILPTPTPAYGKEWIVDIDDRLRDIEKRLETVAKLCGGEES